MSTTAYPSHFHDGQPLPRRFPITCFETGDFGICLYSFICPPCAMASARQLMDESSFLTTCFNANPVALRWLVRSAYHIPGSEVEDCLLGTFCSCCIINQLIHTTKEYGRPNLTTGAMFNSSPLGMFPRHGNCCSNCLCATFCMPCSFGTILQRSMGMPFWMGCLCMNFCMTRNVLRYHYRLNGSDLCEECFLPNTLFNFADYFTTPDNNPFWYLIISPYFISSTMAMLAESEGRGYTGPYLSAQPAHGVQYVSAPPLPPLGHNPYYQAVPTSYQDVMIEMPPVSANVVNVYGQPPPSRIAGSRS